MPCAQRILESGIKLIYSHNNLAIHVKKRKKNKIEIEYTFQTIKGKINRESGKNECRRTRSCYSEGGLNPDSTGYWKEKN